MTAVGIPSPPRTKYWLEQVAQQFWFCVVLLFGSFRLALGVFVCAGLGENVARMICFRFEVMVSVVFGGGYREDFGDGGGRLGRWRHHTTQDGTNGIRHVSVQALEEKKERPVASSLCICRG